MAMSPIERAMAVYQAEPCARPFQVDLASHLLYGFVFSTPDLFLMGRPVRTDATPEEILDPSVDFVRPDGWLVYCAAGQVPLSAFLALEPYPLPYIGWERRNQLRFYRREQLIRATRPRMRTRNTNAELDVGAFLKKHRQIIA